MSLQSAQSKNEWMNLRRQPLLGRPLEPPEQQTLFQLDLRARALGHQKLALQQACRLHHRCMHHQITGNASKTPEHVHRFVHPKKLEFQRQFWPQTNQLTQPQIIKDSSSHSAHHSAGRTPRSVVQKEHFNAVEKRLHLAVQFVTWAMQIVTRFPMEMSVQPVMSWKCVFASPNQCQLCGH